MKTYHVPRTPTQLPGALGMNQLFFFSHFWSGGDGNKQISPPTIAPSQNQLQRDEGSLHQQQGGPLQRGNPSTSRPDSRNVPIAVDASDSHLGAVLQQQARGAALSHSVSSQRCYRSCTTEILWFPQRAILHGVLSGSEAFPPPPGRAEVLYRDGSQTSHFRPTQRFRTMVSQPNKRAVIPCRESS